jgi:hypothetical protein
MGNNSTPTTKEIESCSTNLRAQIDLINPRIVVTLGAVALKATAFIEPHGLALTSSVRTSHSWYGRELIPLYHPGQRAMIHRSFLNQLADYQYVAERKKRIGQPVRKVVGSANRDATALAAAVLGRFGALSYFQFHKLSYLAEYLYAKEHGSRLTAAYFVRQKDGPYCVDLHPQRLKAAGCDVLLSGAGPTLRIVAVGAGLFSDSRDSGGVIEGAVEEVFNRYAGLSPERLKTAVYLTRPMRQLLAHEKKGHSRFNAPLEFM